MRPADSLWSVWCVWRRYFAVFRKSIPYYLVTTFLEPLLYLLAFGFGVGSLVGTVTTEGVELSYRRFIFSGIIAQTVLFQGFYEGAFGAFVRMYYQRIFQAIAITPITLSEVLWGELLWDATKATAAAEVVALIGVMTGDFSASSLLVLPPVCFIAALLFSAMGLAAAAFARNIEQLSYPQYLLVFPMFLFCGVFYPVDALPGFLQGVAWALPLTSVNAVIRTLTLGIPLPSQAIAMFAVWFVVLVALGHRAMFRRLVR